MCREIIEASAPATYTHHARNPARSVQVGGDATVFAPAYGSPFVHDLDDGRHYLATTVEGGWHVPTWPQQYGGRGASPSQNALIGRLLREFVVPDLYPFAIGLGMVGPALLAHGTQEQQQEWLRPIASGTSIWCQMFSEPEAGSDLANVALKADQDGEEWVVPQK
jgi:alkylation response protein AidB-like acyl-CoA dehydrogenase